MKKQFIGSLLLIFAAALSASASREEPRAKPITLSIVERAFLAKARVAGQTSVPVHMATREGRSETVGAACRQLGATITMLEKDVDYLVLDVPIDRLDAIARLPDIVALEVMVDNEVEFRGEDAVSAPSASGSGKPPTAYTPRDNPYTGERESQSLQLKTQHPTYDGRGVVIGGFEPVDTRLPSLQWAISANGARIPKILDYVALPPQAIDVDPIPAHDQFDFGWQKTMLLRPDKGGFVSFNGVRYTVPREVGTHDVRLALHRTRLGSYAAGADEFIVLWWMEGGKAWINIGSDHDFNHGVAFPELSKLPYGIAVTAPPDKSDRTIGLAVDKGTGTLRLYVGANKHGTMCASVATGHSYLNGGAEGVAPAAQVHPISYASGSSLDAAFVSPVPAWLSLFRDRRVDLITSSTMVVNSQVGIADERFVHWHLLSRLQSKYPKTMLQAAGNSGPARSQSGPKTSDAIITVGAYLPREVLRANFGLEPQAQHTAAPFSAYGPADDGGLKPDLLAYSGTLTGFRRSTEDDGASPYYEMPDGYGLSGGTSSAAPHAAGLVALLVSAAKQAGVPYDPARLKVALFSTAKFLPGIKAHVQGHGLIQVAQAWEKLKSLSHYAPDTFETQAPVKTFWSGDFSTPHTGRGLYERTGWSPGQSGERVIRLKRTSGAKGPLTYMLRWMGDTTAFSSSTKSIDLPLDQTVVIPISVRVGESDAYAAILDLIDPAMNVVVHSVMCTVIAGESLNTQNGYTASVTRSIPRPGQGFAFIEVPSGTTALRIQVHQRGGKSVMLRALQPNGDMPKTGEQSARGAYSWWSMPSSSQESYDLTFERPVPGVWQFWMVHDAGHWPRRYDSAEPLPARGATFTLKATALGLQAEERPSATPATRLVLFTNKLGTLENLKAAPIGIGAARTETFSLGTTADAATYELEVPAGASKLTAEVEIVADGSADVSVMALYQAADTDKRRVMVAAREFGAGRRKRIHLLNPHQGHYTIWIHARNFGADPVKVRYVGAVYHPLYGELVAKELPRRPGSSDIREVSVGWNLRGRPSGDRTLVGEVGLFNDSIVALTRSFKGAPDEDVLATPRPVPVATQMIVLEARDADGAPSQTVASFPIY